MIQYKSAVKRIKPKTQTSRFLTIIGLILLAVIVIVVGCTVPAFGKVLVGVTLVAYFGVMIGILLWMVWEACE